MTDVDRLTTVRRMCFYIKSNHVFDGMREYLSTRCLQSVLSESCHGSPGCSSTTVNGTILLPTACPSSPSATPSLTQDAKHTVSHVSHFLMFLFLGVHNVLSNQYKVLYFVSVSSLGRLRLLTRFRDPYTYLRLRSCKRCVPSLRSSSSKTRPATPS